MPLPLFVVGAIKIGAIVLGVGGAAKVCVGLLN